MEAARAPLRSETENEESWLEPVFGNQLRNWGLKLILPRTVMMRQSGTAVEHFQTDMRDKSGEHSNLYNREEVVGATFSADTNSMDANAAEKSTDTFKSSPLQNEKIRKAQSTASHAKPSKPRRTAETSHEEPNKYSRKNLGVTVTRIHHDALRASRSALGTSCARRTCREPTTMLVVRPQVHWD